MLLTFLKLKQVVPDFALWNDTPLLNNASLWNNESLRGVASLWKRCEKKTVGIKALQEYSFFAILF